MLSICGFENRATLIMDLILLLPRTIFWVDPLHTVFFASFNISSKFLYKLIVLVSPRVLIRPSAIGKMNSPCLGNITSLTLSFFLSRFPMRSSSPTPQTLQPVRHPSKFSPRTMCEGEGDVVAVVAPLGGVAQVILHGV